MNQLKQNKLLIELYLRYQRGEQEPVTELALEESLRVTYKKLHELSAFWISKGCVKSFAKRGGQSAYVITSMGLIEAEKLMRQQRHMYQVLIILCVLLVVLSFIFL